jgi:hypothetical protein
MDLRITQTWPKIGIETQRGNLSITNNNKIGLTLSHSEPQIQISTTNAQLHIDQTECFADTGIKNNKDFASDRAQFAEQNLLDYIGKMSSNGDRLAKMEQGGKRNLQIIHEEQYDTVDYNFGLMPTHRPSIDVELGEFNMEVIEGVVNNQYSQIPLEMDYTPSKVQFYMLQRGSVNIEYVGKNIDVKL